mmetsp:Transcript_6810/g.12143  ORF Transcript_6810/g.12143 Transcript_6810/m.12143 type:complete len:91 (-) Transcript_6810:147-419(-)
MCCHSRSVLLHPLLTNLPQRRQLSTFGSGEVGLWLLFSLRFTTLGFSFGSDKLLKSAGGGGDVVEYFWSLHATYDAHDVVHVARTKQICY